MWISPERSPMARPSSGTVSGRGRREVVVSGREGKASSGDTAGAGGAHCDGGNRRA